MPDDELLARAAAGDLRKPGVIAAQARRMLKDPRARALAVEFGGNWLDFRRFQDIATVDRERFPAFTNELRKAMFEEPVRLAPRRDADEPAGARPALRQRHVRESGAGEALRHAGAAPDAAPRRGWRRGRASTTPTAYGRGGLLPMAAFLTKNAPGLRTSPVKRGNWVVKNVLGEHISPPPPTVPQLPQDEAKLDLPLRETMERHRHDPQCAACHAKFDAMGLVFEGYGPVGERRDTDLAGRPVDVSATFPGGSHGAGARRPARLHPRAPAARLRRQRQRQAAGLRAGPQPAAHRRAARRGHEPHARRQRLPLRQPGREHRHQPSVPEQARSAHPRPQTDGVSDESTTSPQPNAVPRRDAFSRASA